MTTPCQKDAEFWNNTPLEALTEQEWEALCDGCGKCCLHKIEDINSGRVYYTDLVCHLIDLHSCQCKDYVNRHQSVFDCIAFTAKDIDNMPWLPDTCAYRLRHLGEPLYEWHYLISGNKQSVHEAGESVRDFAVLDAGQNLEEHIIYFKP